MSLITTQIQMEKEHLEMLKANKKVNGLTLNWQMKTAIELYIKTNKLDKLVEDEKP